MEADRELKTCCEAGVPSGPPLERSSRDEELAALCKALGHPVRVAILRHLAQVDGCICGRIVEVLPLAQSTVSQHLKILKESGLVRGEVQGPRTCYCLDRNILERCRGLLEEFGAGGLENVHA